MNDRLTISFQRYICELCGSRYERAGECDCCEGVRLRDLTDPATRNWITTQDASRRSQRLRTVVVAASLLALPVPFVLPELLGPLPVGPEVLWGLAALGFGIALGRLFRTQQLCPEFTDAEERWMRSLRPPRGVPQRAVAASTSAPSGGSSQDPGADGARV